MLVLSRKAGEQILIGDNVRLTVLQTRCDKVRLGFEAPKDVSIDRSEVRGAKLTGQPVRGKGHK